MAYKLQTAYKLCSLKSISCVKHHFPSLQLAERITAGETRLRASSEYEYEYLCKIRCVRLIRQARYRTVFK